MTDIQTIKDVTRSFYESYNQRDLDASFAAYISPDLVNHVLGGVEREYWLSTDKTVFPAFTDFQLDVLDQVAEGDKVATRFRLGGKQTGEFFGIPASGNTAFLNATAVDRVVGGQIVEHWMDFDLGAFLQQLSGEVVHATGAHAKP